VAFTHGAPWDDWWAVHYRYAAVVLAAFLLGGLLGALALDALGGSSRLVLAALVARFMHLTVSQTPPVLPLIRAALEENLKVVGILYLLGVSIAGLPLVVLAIVFRGFVLGFATAFLLGTVHTLGPLVVAVAVLLPQALLVPAWLATGAGAVRFSWTLLTGAREPAARHLGREWADFTAVALMAALLALAGSLVQAVAAPWVLHWVLPAVTAGRMG
jgi:stage II sporulation protein M